MGKQQTDNSNRTNVVYLEGIIKTLKLRDDESAFVLLDVNPDSKYISLTIHQSRELHGQLSAFRVEDKLQIQGFLRAWSQQKNNVWENKTEVRITRIANKPPERRQQQAAAVADDDVPF